MQYKEQESSVLKRSTGELTSDRDSANAELSAVVEYLVKLNDMCIAEAMMYEEKSQRRAAEIAGLKEALSILSESALLQWPQTVQRVNIHRYETLSSDIASTKAAIEDDAAKVASTSASIASLASQNVVLGLGPDRSERRESKAMQALPTEAEQVAEQQKDAADLLTKHRTTPDSLRKSLYGKRTSRQTRRLLQ